MNHDFNKIYKISGINLGNLGNLENLVKIVVQTNSLRSLRNSLRPCVKKIKRKDAKNYAKFAKFLFFYYSNLIFSKPLLALLPNGLWNYFQNTFGTTSKTPLEPLPKRLWIFTAAEGTLFLETINKNQINKSTNNQINI